MSFSLIVIVGIVVLVAVVGAVTVFAMRNR